MSAAQRVRQFVRALTQHLDEDDRRFTAKLAEMTRREK